MTTIRLVADDLTGALDAAVQFTSSVPCFPVLLTGEPGRIDITPEASVAISTGNRDLDPATASDRAAAAAAMLADANIAFIKIDSLLRGNWPVELARVLEKLPKYTCIFAPAFPAERRFMRDGQQFAPDPDGRMAALPRTPHHELTAVGLRARVISAGMAPSRDPGGVLICDAMDEDDLNALVAASRSFGGRVLWCGSAGLARALAAHAPPALTPAATRPLVVIGSCHPVLLAQLATLPAEAAVRIALGPDAAECAGRIDRVLERVPCLLSVDLSPRLLPHLAAGEIRERLGAVLPRLRPPECLVVIGGETLSSVCSGVGATALVLEGEWRPGVPCSRIKGGMWDGVPVVSRSGAFAGRDFFTGFLDACAGQSIARASPGRTHPCA